MKGPIPATTPSGRRTDMENWPGCNMRHGFTADAAAFSGHGAQEVCPQVDLEVGEAHGGARLRDKKVRYLLGLRFDEVRRLEQDAFPVGGRRIRP